MNELMFFGVVLVYLVSVVVFYKFFGKNGLYVYSIFSTLLANVSVLKCIDVFGFTTNAGVALYASSFLVTDILSENYGKKDAAKAVHFSLAALFLWIVGTQLTMVLAPSANDQFNTQICSIFGFTPRIFVASMAGYIFSQSFDVFVYHFIWEKTGNSAALLWMRNNFSTLLSQAIDTTIFVTLAFLGYYPLKVFFSMMLTTYMFKALVALLDTPFAYIARKIKPLNFTEKRSFRKQLTPGS